MYVILFYQITYVIYVFENILCSLVINLSFDRRVFPKSLKTEILIQMFKKDDCLDCSNYNLISLTSNLSILIEKLINAGIYLFLENNKGIYNH